MKKVFLGGTCNGSKWRDILIPKLKIDYFNPVVENWDEEAQKREVEERQNCDYCLYVITPKMSGVYSIAEVVEDSIKRPEKTLFFYFEVDQKKEFDQHQLKSLKQVAQMVKNNGAKVFENSKELINFLNNQ
jgi:hypothetical protein